jgi:hypothetical protein
MNLFTVYLTTFFNSVACILPHNRMITQQWIGENVERIDRGTIRAISRTDVVKLQRTLPQNTLNTKSIPPRPSV